MRYLPLSTAAVFISLLHTTFPAWADTTQPENAVQAETLPDGNILDPQPSAETLKKMLAVSQKNMIFLAGGTFDMGDWGSKVNKNGLPFDGDSNSKPLHKVKLDGFSMGKYPVTYAEFDVFTAFLQLPRTNQQSFMLSYRKPDNPVGVSWQGAKDYCTWLGKQANLPIDLPTEAQWEYAARSGGKHNLFPTDNGQLEKGRNISSPAQREAAGGLVSVSSFPANPAGFHYFGDAVREWVNDWYDEKYYTNSPQNNPRGPGEGTERVVRGNFGDTEMVFKRWSRKMEEKTGTWKKYAEKKGDENREIPYTKYSALPNSAFRCVLNHTKPIN
ncbi:sulfatase modifying factor 1 [Oxalobacteraceae bacterium GrIS 1.11]